jgi:arylsulfatase A-like enzyme
MPSQQSQLLQRRSLLQTSALAGLGSLLLPQRSHGIFHSESKPPNIVLILVDDMGWMDTGCYGSKIYETPNIDRLAAQGMRFTDAYSACTVCSPTRAALLTGKYPARLHLTDWIPGHGKPMAKFLPPEFNQELPLKEVTIAESLKPLGYKCASIGKWHLGGEGFLPDTQGFDLNTAGTHKGQPPSYHAPYNIPTLKEGEEGEYLTDRMANEATAFIEENKENPFFLYLPFFAVHTPIQGKKDYEQKYLDQGLPKDGVNRAGYAAMIQSTDEAVGKVMAKLDELNIADNTFVFFTSDNGGLRWITDNSPLREGKGSAYEGGVRVPLIIRGQGIEAGSLSDEAVISCDMYPTIMELLNQKIPKAQKVDGESLLPILNQSGDLERNAIFWHYPHYHPGGATPYSAVRAGEYRLVYFYETRTAELYQTKKDRQPFDLAETENLIQNRKSIAQYMQMRLNDWIKDTRAQMPKLNPNYDPDNPGSQE